MIGWLEGTIIEYINKGVGKALIIACGGVGYEVNLLTRHPEKILPLEKYSIWVHQLQREDSTVLYGFEKKIERDLFRRLIAVNGIGPKVAMSLLDNLSPQELVNSIINKQIDNLKRSPGVGKKMAERLSIELKDKLTEFQNLNLNKDLSQITIKGFKTNSKLIPLQNELIDTLRSLEYDENEITNAISLLFETTPTPTGLNKEDSLEENNNFEALLKSAVILLSQDHS